MGVEIMQSLETHPKASTWAVTMQAIHSEATQQRSVGLASAEIMYREMDPEKTVLNIISVCLKKNSK